MNEHTETKKHLERNPLRGNVLTSYWNISGSVSSSTSFTCYLLYSITLSLSLSPSLSLSLTLYHSVSLSPSHSDYAIVSCELSAKDKNLN